MKRLVYIFLSVLLVIPHGLHAEQGKQEQKTEEKKSGWGWTSVAAAGTLAAILGYLGYQAMQDEENQAISTSSKRTPQEYSTAIHKLENIYRYDPQIQAKVEGEKKQKEEWFGSMYQQSITKQLDKKYHSIIKDYKDVAEKKFNPIDIQFFENNRVLKGDKDFFALYYPLVLDYYIQIIGSYGTGKSYNDMRKIIPSLPAKAQKSPAVLLEEEREKQLLAQRQKREAGRKQQDAATQRQQENELNKNVCIARKLEQIYAADQNIIKRAQDPNSGMVTVDAYLKNYYKETRDLYPQVYEQYSKMRSEADPLGINTFYKINNFEFNAEYYGGMVYYFESVIGKRGTSASVQLMNNAIEKCK